MAKQYKIQIQFQGKRPIMFDRYAGDNNTSLEPRDKMHLNGDGAICIPYLNILSMLAAENTKSVTKVFYPPKMGVKLRHTLNSFLMIDQDMIPLNDGDGTPITFDGRWTEKVYIHKSVARLPKGIPNPKERPCIDTPWSADFSIDWMENKDISVDALAQVFRHAGFIGLGTFRPQFGQFELTGFDAEEV